MAEQTFQIMLVPGDGVGAEVTAEATSLLETIGDRIGAHFEFNEVLMGGAAIDAYGTPLREEEIETARRSDAVLFGAAGGPKWDALAKEERPERGLLRLRQELGLFANVRPVKVFDALVDSTPLKPEVVRGADLIVLRELTGGLYYGQPSERRRDERGRSAIDTLPYHEGEVERIVDLAFRLASERRRKVTSVDKSNVLNTSQLWREVATEVASRYPDVAVEHVLVDSCAMRLVSRPRDFDVMVMENLFGDILSDEAAVLAGSLGMLPSASLHGRPPERAGSAARLFGLYEPVHGSAPDIAGQGIANPIGSLLSSAMMLRYSFGLNRAADAVEAGVAAALDEGLRTADIAAGGRAVSTGEMGRRVRELAVERLDQPA